MSASPAVSASGSKVVVFCVDSLCSIDLEPMRELPNLGPMVRDGAHARQAEPVYPTLTYPNHVSIITGNFVDRHGVPHNQKVVAGAERLESYTQRSEVHGDTLLDRARTYGRSTCSLSWPVTGGAEFDLNMPMIVPMDFTGPDPIRFLDGNATPELLERYYDRYFHYLTGPDRSLDAFTMALAPEIVRDLGQPDVMLIKLCDLDTARHEHGVSNDVVDRQLRIHDAQVGEIVDTIREHGDLARTNFLVVGDHGQTDITGALNLNVLFRRAGLIEVDDEGAVSGFEAFCHSVELTAWVQLADPSDRHARRRVEDLLGRLADDPAHGISEVLTAAEVKDRYRADGPFDYVVHGRNGVTFGPAWQGDDPFAPHVYKNHPQLRATHGGLPNHHEPSTLVLSGPGVVPGASIDRCSLVDVAPTAAALAGFDLEDVDGRVLVELIR